jgi:low temperature requirement protein LtrA
VTAGTGPADVPLRVTTLELFFDLVFAFTLTQLTAVAIGLRAVAMGQVLLVFGLLWWMYEGYAWLTNTRPPVHAAERLLLLVGMAGFLVVGLTIPRGFGADGVALGLGYLVVVLVHAVLYYRVNANIVLVAPSTSPPPCSSRRPGRRAARPGTRCGPPRWSSSWARRWSFIPGTGSP